MSSTFVLITGAFHGGWAWRPVAEHLRAAGHRVVTPTLPGLADGDDPSEHSLADVVDFVVELVQRKDLRDVTLVGHSWGGYVITGAAPRLAARLRKLVYWAAFVPTAGKALIDDVTPELQAMLRSLAEASGNKSVTLPYELWQQAFTQDATEPVQRLTYQLMVPQPFQYFTETVEPLDFETFHVPVSYLLSVDDVVIPPDEYRRYAARLGVDPTAAPGGHEACFTQPQGLAESLLTA